MVIPRVLQVGFGSLLGVAALWAGAELEAVSPGSATGTVIADGCPTFSWTAVDGAESYELVVYRVKEELKDAEPVLRQVLGSALSWTPSLDRCLAAGARYAWSVRAVDPLSESGWSPPSLFEVSAGPSEAEFQSALALVVDYLEGNEGLSDRPAARESEVEAVPGPSILDQPTEREVTAMGATVESTNPVLPILETALPAAPSTISLVTDGAIAVGTSTPLADLHVVGGASLGGMILAPNEPFSGTSEILLAEDSDATFGMKIKYDGSTNHLEFWGHQAGTDLGPWLTINRNNGVVGEIYRYKTAIETVTGSTAFQDDDHLFFDVGVNERWTFEALLWVSTSSATGDIQFVWRGPGGSDVRANMVAYEGNGVVTQSTVLGMDTVMTVDYAAAASIQPIYMKGVFSTTSSGGTVRLQWSQVVASGTTQVYLPSQLEARRVVW